MLHTSGPRRIRFAVALVSLSLFATAFGIACAQQKKEQHRAAIHKLEFQCLFPPGVTMDDYTDEAAALAVCAGDSVTFCSAGTKAFSVDFQKSPFKPDSSTTPARLHFDERDCKSTFTVKALDVTNKFEIYKFMLVINGKSYDPHVIIVPGSGDQ
jgi:hypothetical protein